MNTTNGELHERDGKKRDLRIYVYHRDNSLSELYWHVEELQVVDMMRKNRQI